MKQVEKFFKEDFKEHICFTGEESKNIKYAYETGFRKAIEFITDYLQEQKWIYKEMYKDKEILRSLLNTNLSLDIQAIAEMADKEVEE